MSKTALRVSPDGTKEMVKIEEINQTNRCDHFICGGKNPHTGQLCEVEVTPVLRKDAPHFRGIMPHIPGCPNDESEAATIIQHLDVTGRTTTIDALLTICGRGEHEGNKGEPRHRDTKPVSGGETEDVEDEVHARRILRKARNPKNLKELCALLVKSDLNALYANIPIGDIIVDHRNVHEYRQKGLRDGQMAVILCSRIKTKYIDKLVPEDRKYKGVILRDAYSYEDREYPLLLFIDGSNAVKSKIFGAPKGNIIAIFGRWHPISPDTPNVCVCDHIYDGQVFVATKDFFAQ